MTNNFFHLPDCPQQPYLLLLLLVSSLNDTKFFKHVNPNSPPSYMNMTAQDGNNKLSKTDNTASHFLYKRIQNRRKQAQQNIVWQQPRLGDTTFGASPSLVFQKCMRVEHQCTQCILLYQAHSFIHASHFFTQCQPKTTYENSHIGNQKQYMKSNALLLQVQAMRLLVHRPAQRLANVRGPKFPSTLVETFYQGVYHAPFEVDGPGSPPLSSWPCALTGTRPFSSHPAVGLRLWLHHLK